MQRHVLYGSNRVSRAASASWEPAPDLETDGRRRRSQDSRARIVQAMLDLVREGGVSPAAEVVAERAGVGLRTVFRHFKDMDSLYREMGAAIEAELQTVIAQPFEAQDWRGRVRELISRRSVAYERITPFRRAAEGQRLRKGGALAADYARFVAMARDILRRVLPEEAAADQPLFEALDLLLSFDAWDRLRRDQNLPPEAAVAALDRAVSRLIGEA